MTLERQMYHVNMQTARRTPELPAARQGSSDSDADWLNSGSSSRAAEDSRVHGHPPFREPGGSRDHTRQKSTSVSQNTTDFVRPLVPRFAGEEDSYIDWSRIAEQSPGTLSKSAASRNSVVPSKRLPSIPQIPPTNQSANLSPHDLPSDTSSHNSRDHSDSASDSFRLSIYDWDSHLVESERSSSPTTRHSTSIRGYSQDSFGRPDVDDPPEPSAAEVLAEKLQKTLSPPPPETIDDLFVNTRDAIEALVEGVQLKMFGRTEYDKSNDNLVRTVVDAVRNLLYISAVFERPSDHDIRTPTTEPQPTKRIPTDAQHKVTIALSKLVLTALQDGVASGASDAPNHIEEDAEELKRTVAIFVRELQREQLILEKLVGRSGVKRLRGVFSSANVGLGLAGAGAAGSWRGFGWVHPREDESEPGTIFRSDVMTEVRLHRSHLEDHLDALAVALEVPGRKSVEGVAREGQLVVARLSAFLAFVGDIHIAEHVDIEDTREESERPASNDVYAEAVNRARLLIRTLESSMQSLYDDGASLLLSTQTVLPTDPEQTSKEREAHYDGINVLATSLIYGLVNLQETLDALLSVGEEQNIICDDFNGRIDWRMSRSKAVDDELSGQFPVRRAYEDTEDLPPAFDDTNTDAWANGLFSDQGHTPASELPHSSPNKKLPRAEKLKQILGDEAPQTYINTLKPWYLRPTYSPSEILIDADGSVRGGTLEALVERLTAHEHGDPTFKKVFLTTYKSFTTLDHLFDLLVERFRIPPPGNLNLHELAQWVEQKQRVIQIRVLNVFKTMVQDDILEKEDAHILERMKDFAYDEDVDRFPASKQLLALVERSKRGGDCAVKTLTNTSLSAPPSSIIPKTLRILDALDIDPTELARQLTLLESQLYRKIRPLDCLQRAREQQGGEHDNITLFVQTFDRIANWITDSILAQEDFRRRAAFMKHFIIVADRCREMNNYSSMVAIVSGLTSTPIRRLKQSWDQVPVRYKTQLSACEVITDPRRNFSNYRTTLANVTPPCVPFIGVFLRALLFIHDGNKENLSENLINFRKRQKTAEVIQDIKQWQSMPFNFHPLPYVLTYIEESLSRFQKHAESDLADHFWNVSLEREPRVRQEYRVAKLLHDSGFL